MCLSIEAVLNYSVCECFMCQQRLLRNLPHATCGLQEPQGGHALWVKVPLPAHQQQHQVAAHLIQPANTRCWHRGHAHQGSAFRLWRPQPRRHSPECVERRATPQPQKVPEQIYKLLWSWFYKKRSGCCCSGCFFSDIFVCHHRYSPGNDNYALACSIVMGRTLHNTNSPSSLPYADTMGSSHWRQKSMPDGYAPPLFALTINWPVALPLQHSWPPSSPLQV